MVVWTILPAGCAQYWIMVLEPLVFGILPIVYGFMDIYTGRLAKVGKKGVQINANFEGGLRCVY